MNLIHVCQKTFGFSSGTTCIHRVTIFLRQRIGTVVVLHDFSGDLKKKKGGLLLFTPATQVFLQIFEWSSQKNKKPGHFHQAAGTWP